MRIIEVFTSIQGEGAQTGVPMHFVRFAGCNLRCPGCDTKESQSPLGTGDPWSIEDVLQKFEYANSVRWACFTGGEPALQFAAWSELSRVLQERGCSLAMETNGSLWIPKAILQRFDWVVVSPKQDVRSVPLLAAAHEIKLVLGHPSTFSNEQGLRDQLNFIQSLGHQKYPPNISIQPWLCGDEAKDRGMLKLAVQLAKRANIRLSAQLHKYIGVR